MPLGTRIVLGLAALALVAGCKDSPPPPKKQLPPPEHAVAPIEPQPEGVRVELANTGPVCRRTLCIGGPGEPGSEPHRDLAELCRRAPGVVLRCEGRRCSSVWSVARWREALEGMLGTLDENGDGKLDERDRSCPISLAGWSSGAVIVADGLPRALAGRVDRGHAEIHNLLAIAPHAPGLEQLEVADNVRRAFIYRHSVTPKRDCSKDFEGGPWLSPKPSCSEHTTCYDYDYSLNPDELAYLGRHGARSGGEVGHCNIVGLVAKIGLDNLARGEEALMQLIPPYSDGTHGGRQLAAGPAKPDPIRVLPNEPEPD